MKLALVYDRVNTWGGAEQILLALHSIWPEAPLYTAVYHAPSAPWAKVFPAVIPSFLQRLPWAKTHHQWFPWATPLAFESLHFDEYDAVISVTSADAKGIITRPGTFHLCYCLTPTRYLYSHPTLPPLLSDYLKWWDSVACHRPDAYLAISHTVQNRIAQRYGQPSSVVYPPVDLASFTPGPPRDYFLSVGRLVYHKQPELLVTIFDDLQSLLKQFKPEAVAVEQLFFNTNAKTAMLVGQARGVVLVGAKNYG